MRNMRSEDSVDHVMSTEQDEASSNTSVSLPSSPLLSENPSSPPSNRPSMPPTPIALTQTAKAARMIADIRQKAYARESSSPEPAPLVFDADMTSSDDDEDELPSQIFQSSK